MKALIVLCLLTFVTGSLAQCICQTMKWATCGDSPPCTCAIQLDDNVRQTLNCQTLIPKCYLMKAEMYRAKNNLSTRSIGGKPVETAFVDNDGIYDPVCENDGRFKAIQCNNTETCWCVNSAGVRRSDKGDKNIKCEPVETYWVRLQLTHEEIATTLDPAALKIGFSNELTSRYNTSSSLIKNFEYDSKARIIVVDVEKPKGDPSTDLSRMAYYMEKDVKVLPLFQAQKPFQINAAGTDVKMKNILVYYVDEVPPTFSMQKLTGGVIAVIVVVVLAVAIGLLVLFFMNRRAKQQYTKAQGREMETMS